jgi:hypothetical protein
MKRDMELVRSILLKVAAEPKMIGTDELVPLLGEKTEENHQIINYHLKMLVDEAGWLSGNERRSVNAGGFYDFLFLYLTWQGNEFLDSIREETNWHKTKKIAATAGTWTVKAIYEISKAVAVEAAKAALKQHGVSLS